MRYDQELFKDKTEVVSFYIFLSCKVWYLGMGVDCRERKRKLQREREGGEERERKIEKERMKERIKERKRV